MGLSGNFNFILITCCWILKCGLEAGCKIQQCRDSMGITEKFAKILKDPVIEMCWTNVNILLDAKIFLMSHFQHL